METPSSRCEHCGQLLPKSREWKNRRFILGIVLAAVTFVPFGIAFVDGLRTVSEAKTTGLGAVAGGLSEFYVMFGLAVVVAVSVLAIVLLIKSFSPEEPIRMLGSIIGITWCGLVVFLAVVSVFLMRADWAISIRR